MIGIDPQCLDIHYFDPYHILPYLTTKVNSFDDLNKNKHFFIKSTADVT